MAKGAYIGTSGTAKKIKKIYVGTAGTAHKVKKAYIGVGGVAKLWFTSGAASRFIYAGYNKSYATNQETPSNFSALGDIGTTTATCLIDYDKLNDRFVALAFKSSFPLSVYTLPAGATTWTALSGSVQYASTNCRSIAIDPNDGSMYFVTWSDGQYQRTLTGYHYNITSSGVEYVDSKQVLNSYQSYCSLCCKFVGSYLVVTGANSNGQFYISYSSGNNTWTNKTIDIVRSTGSNTYTVDGRVGLDPDVCLHYENGMYSFAVGEFCGQSGEGYYAPRLIGAGKSSTIANLKADYTWYCKCTNYVSGFAFNKAFIMATAPPSGTQSTGKPDSAGIWAIDLGSGMSSGAVKITDLPTGLRANMMCYANGLLWTAFKSISTYGSDLIYYTYDLSTWTSANVGGILTAIAMVRND